MSTSPRWFSSVAAGLALAAALAVPAQAGLADQVGATFGLMLQEVVSAFPPVEGLVVQVDGDRIYMDLSKKDGVLPGQEYTVFRKGEVFRHPASGKPLGRYEETVGVSLRNVSQLAQVWWALTYDARQVLGAGAPANRSAK